ncbi:NUDIX hydrolase [Stomatohabitans albus]|uniref:NUDIX hydrolase n=1 Tax=Stomatohabitans albus TaxID=3110766 RepID=UPI00300C30F9
MSSSSKNRTPEHYGVDAAGAVVWRESDGYVVLVHRPRYDDWSLPKGKCDPGECFAQTAVREVEEETGITGTLGEWIDDVTYPVPGPDGGEVTKTVVFYALEATHIPDFVPNDEVDVLVWVPIDQAITRTSYQGDRNVLAAFMTAQEINETG